MPLNRERAALSMQNLYLPRDAIYAQNDSKDRGSNRTLKWRSKRKGRKKNSFPFRSAEANAARFANGKRVAIRGPRQTAEKKFPAGLIKTSRENAVTLAVVLCKWVVGGLNTHTIQTTELSVS
ncbi:hypothetical protein PUN28_010968 [Cardiocondyla obscurior]|uniref:Uncharacterized protein n=1 Tax=Cardiocondyla obscurior TaxID=286306 RepID=A0AAW2FIL7_9HYME